MLNIEHLRKQAKLYVRWHRQQYYPVAARIRAVLPRYSRLIDRDVLAQPFAVRCPGARCENGRFRQLGGAPPGKSLRDPHPHR